MPPTDGNTPNPSSDHLALERLVAAVPAILYQFRLEFRGIRDGEVRWIGSQAIPEIEPDGSVVWRRVLTDVTQHRQAEDALRESEEGVQFIHKPLSMKELGITVRQILDGD